MKNLLFKIILCVFLSILVSSLTPLISQCEFVATESSEPVLTDYSATDIHLNLVFHIIRKNDGTGTTTFSDIYAYLAELAAVYNPKGIYFDTLCTKFINNTSYYEDCRLDMRADTFPGIQRLYATADAVNIFIQPSDGSMYCPGSGNGLIYGHSCWIINNGHRNLCSHELGHVLNLWHTFETYNGPSCLDDPSSLIYSGDLCLDTPPDENKFDSTGRVVVNLTNCNWDTAACITKGHLCTDGCGNYPHPGFDPKIMMSYYHECTAFFTTDQANRMKDKIINKLSNTDFSSNRADSIITDSAIVDVPWRAAKNIIIENGGVLIVQSTLYMPEETKIVIEPGGILNIDGGTITKGNFKDICGERSGDPKFWHGIEMQFTTSGPMPKLHCSNGTIEYSEKGIHNLISTSGNGIIYVYSGTFRNNIHSIHLIKGPTANLFPIHIRKARFYLDGSFPLSDYSTQIKIDNSKIYLDSCTFDNPNFKNTINNRNYSIMTMNTDIGIQRTKFKDSIYGVQCLSDLSKATLGVKTSKFTKTRIGVNTTPGVNNYSISQDTFDTSIKIGLLSEKCTGYIINNNLFIRATTPTDSGGIVMVNSSEASNVIQKNVYSNLKYGNVAIGNNGNILEGLQLLCNDYSNFISYECLFKGTVSGMQGQDGNATGNTSTNEVDHNIDSVLYGIPTNFMSYFYVDTIPSHKADSYPKYKMMQKATKKYNCNRVIGKPDTVSRFVLYKKYEDTINNRNNKYTDSIDGGNTSVLLSHISGATAGAPATLLYNQLINKSPWLSSAVILAFYNRSDIFDSTKRAQIIFSNPDPFKSGKFRSDLRNADSPLSSSSLDALDTLTTYATIRTELESEMSWLKLEKSALCYDTLYEFKIDTIDHTDSILVWLQRAGDYGSLREIMEMHFNNGDYTDASSALSNLRELDNLNESQLSDIEGLEDLLPYIIDIREDDRYEGSLTEGEIEWMIEFADNNDNQAGSEVRSALYFYYGIDVDEPESLRAVLDNTKPVIGEASKTNKEHIFDQIMIYPNPSKNELIIQLPTDKTIWDIELMDIHGKLLIASQTHSNKFRMDISKIPNGIFVMQFHSSNGEKITKRIQVIK